MFWIYTPYYWPPLIAGLVSLALAIYMRRWRPVSGDKVLFWLLLAITYWSFVHTLEVGATTLPSKLFLADIQYPAIVSLPVLWFVFVLRYSGWDRRPSRNQILALSVLPAITLLLLWTNPYHGLMRESVALDTTGPISVLVTDYGLWFWVHTAYSYLLLLGGTLVAMQMIFSATRPYIGQSLSLATATLFPLVGNTLFLLQVPPSPYVDTTLSGITLSCALIAWGMHRYGLMDIVPASRLAIIEGMKDGLLVLDLHGRVVDVNAAMLDILNVEAEDIIGESLAWVLPEIAIAKDRKERYADVIQGEGESLRIYEPSVTPLSGRSGRPAGHLIMLNDVTEQRQAEEAINRRNKRLAALNTIAASVSASLELDEVIDTIRQVLSDSLDIPCGALFLHNPAKERLELEKEWGLTAEMRAALSNYPIITTYSGAQWRGGLPGITGLPYYGACKKIARSSSVWCQIIGLPLVARGALQGMLQLFVRAPATFGEDDIAALGTLAQQTGTAIHNARLYGGLRSDARQLQALSRHLVEAQEAERRDIARELHDNVGQVLAALTFVLEYTKYLLPEPISTSLSEAQQRISELVEQVSEMSLLLRPAVLDELGLLAALRSLFSRYTAQTDIKVHFDADDPFIEPDLDIAVAIYRVAQEALNNVARHANVDEVDVTLHTDSYDVMLNVYDPGIGFDTQEMMADRQAGGLMNLRERIKALGGTLDIQSVPGDGTTLIVRLPVRQPEDGAT